MAAKTTWVFGDDGSAEVVRPKLKAWWIKKPPTAAARSKKRWVEVYLDEIKVRLTSALLCVCVCVYVCVCVCGYRCVHAVDTATYTDDSQTVF